MTDLRSHPTVRFRPRPLASLLAFVVLGAGICVGLAHAADEAAEAPKKASKRETSWYCATIARDAQGSFLIVHFWSKGSLFRSEAVLSGRRIVTIVDRTRYMILDALSGTGVSIERSAVAIAQDEGRARPFANELEQLLENGGELVDTETVAGRKVGIYRATNDRGRRTLWVTEEEPRVPLRLETFDRATASEGVIEYVNWLYGIPIADRFFEPDPRVKLREVSYDEYRENAGRVPIGPAPVLYSHLLHGEAE